MGWRYGENRFHIEFSENIVKAAEMLAGQVLTLRNFTNIISFTNKVKVVIRVKPDIRKGPVKTGHKSL